jgi:ATP-dependent DNA helicase RecG
MEIQEVIDAQVPLFLIAREGHFLDVKAREIAPAKLTRSVSAFANSDGGELIIGLDEDREAGCRTWRGFPDPEAANGHIQAFEEVDPLGGDLDYEFWENPNEDGLLLHVVVSKSRDIKNASNGTPYVRRGAQNLPVSTPEALERLRRAKGISSHETETLAVDADALTNSEVTIGFMLQIVPEAEPEVWLRKQRLIVADHPTVAGVLLFADEPQAFVPKASVKIYRYKTTDPEGSRETLAFDPISIDGPVYDQIAGAVAKTTELIQGMQIMGSHGLEDVQYPSEALHEVITNAVLHRDYSFADDVHVRIFDNRVEVESPGRLPAHITPQNILAERFARNASLVRLINKFPDPPNKDVGEGLNTAFAAMRKLQLREPEIAERDNSVLVFLRHEALASPEEVIMEYLASNPEINNQKAREITSIDSEYQVRRIIRRLIEAGEVEKVPGKQSRATAYRRVENPPEDPTAPEPLPGFE